MSASSPLPRPFGPYVLTRAVGSDVLGQAWRAGTPSSSGTGLRSFLYIREFDGSAVDRSALLVAMERVVDALEEIKGPFVARGTVMGAMDDTPFLGVEYMPGRTLDALFSARSSGALLTIEHALLIAEKILAALEASQSLETLTGAPHGFLIPAFVNVSNDGETRVFGGGIGTGLLPALRSPRARLALAPYIAPEVLESGKPSPAGDVYSASILLYESLTGHLPAGPDPLQGATLALDGTPLPEDVKKLLWRGLHPDSGSRERSVASWRRELCKLLYGGPYSPSTFNLAFFMQRHFEKAIQQEETEIATEEQIDASRVKAAAVPAPASPPVTVRSDVEATGSHLPPGPPPPRSPRTDATRVVAEQPDRLPLGGVPVWATAAAVLVLAVGGFSFVQWRQRSVAPVPAPVPVPTPVPPTPVPTPAPVVVGKEDPLFQAAVQARVQEEMTKREQKLARTQDAAKRKKAELDRVAEESRNARDLEETTRAARERADREEAARLAREATAQRQREKVARAAEEAAPRVKEGDVVDAETLDAVPTLVKSVKPTPSFIALRRRMSGTVLLRVLVDETGHPEKVEVIRDTTPAVGLGEACQSALKQWVWSPPTKDGKKVKTWIPVRVPFKLD